MLSDNPAKNILPRGKVLGILILKAALTTLIIGSFIAMLSMVIPNFSKGLLTETSYLRSTGFLFLVIMGISSPFIVFGSLLAFFAYKKIGTIISPVKRLMVFIILGVIASQILYGLLCYVSGISSMDDPSFYPMAFISCLYGIIFALCAFYQEWKYRKQVSAS